MYLNQLNIVLGISVAYFSNYFLERWELGISNVGCDGSVEVDGDEYQLTLKDALLSAWKWENK